LELNDSQAKIYTKFCVNLGNINFMKYRFLVLSILMSQFLFAQEVDYIIRNGKLIDGTGNQWQI